VVRGAVESRGGGFMFNSPVTARGCLAKGHMRESTDRQTPKLSQCCHKWARVQRVDWVRRESIFDWSGWLQSRCGTTKFSPCPTGSQVVAGRAYATRRFGDAGHVPRPGRRPGNRCSAGGDGPYVRGGLARRADSRAGRSQSARMSRRPDPAPRPDPAAQLVPAGHRQTRDNEPGTPTGRPGPELTLLASIASPGTNTVCIRGCVRKRIV